MGKRKRRVQWMRDGEGNVKKWVNKSFSIESYEHFGINSFIHNAENLIYCYLCMYFHFS